MTLSEAESIRLNFGAHKGETLARVARTDLGYLRWLRDQAHCAHETVRKAAEIVLDRIENPRSEYDGSEDEMDL